MAADPRFAAWAAALEGHLERALPPAETAPRRLHAAMRHAVLGGGKRMRALLVYASGALLRADPTTLHAPAIAVELTDGAATTSDRLVRIARRATAWSASAVLMPLAGELSPQTAALADEVVVRPIEESS